MGYIGAPPCSYGWYGPVVDDLLVKMVFSTAMWNYQRDPESRGYHCISIGCPKGLNDVYFDMQIWALSGGMDANSVRAPIPKLPCKNDSTLWSMKHPHIRKPVHLETWDFQWHRRGKATRQGMQPAAGLGAKKIADGLPNHPNLSDLIRMQFDCNSTWQRKLLIYDICCVRQKLIINFLRCAQSDKYQSIYITVLF